MVSRRWERLFPSPESACPHKAYQRYNKHGYEWPRWGKLWTPCRKGSRSNCKETKYSKNNDYRPSKTPGYYPHGCNRVELVHPCRLTIKVERHHEWAWSMSAQKDAMHSLQNGLHLHDDPILLKFKCVDNYLFFQISHRGKSNGVVKEYRARIHFLSSFSSSFFRSIS